MNNNNDIVISTKNLSKVYKLYKNPKDRLKEALSLSKKIYHKDFYALKNINLEIKRGEVIGIVGKNGSGKSTLLKILSRVLTPTSGDFMVKGKVSSLLELGSGFNPELTGIENIFFYATILGIEEKKIKEKLQEILDFADIGDFIYQPLKTYSSGMKARLAFSVAINVEPDILILDEVLAVGDELFRRKCYARMEGFFKGGKTILFVSHSVSNVNELCTRAIMIDAGKHLLEGPTKLVTAHYQRYLFATPENLLRIRNEIENLNSDFKLKEKVYLEMLINKPTTNDNKNSNKSYPDDNMVISPIIPIRSKAYFVSSFKPQSTIEYKNFDVDITDIKLISSDGKIVNVIFTGENYSLLYKVSFNVSAEHINFGMTFKTEKGLNVTGSNSSNFGVLLSTVAINSSFQVRWDFQCNLLFGNYYVNIGVHSINSGGRTVLNRIVDAIVFKVAKEENKLYSGIANIYQIPTIVELG